MYMIMKRLFLFIVIPFLLSSCAVSDDKQVIQEGEEPALVDFENVYFDDLSLVYDGNQHILEEVRGAPADTTITYKGREAFTDVGIYPASATLSKDGYNDKTLTATLTITRATFENITFENKEFDYDGEAHYLAVEGAPSFATVTYSNNGKRSVGTYTVTATISAPNYNKLTKTATLRIIGKEITGASFNDQTVVYNGSKHYLEVEGDIPDDVDVSYTNNGKVDAGSYKVTAKLSGEGYVSKELSATLTITPAELDKPGYFYDRFFIYDGQNHSLTVDSAPNSATVTYKCLNVSGTNTFKNPGEYDIEATVKVNNNYMSVLRATMFIIEEGTVGVDSSKEGLKIDENLKWDELYEALSHDNFTYDYYSGSYDTDSLDNPFPSDILEESFSGHDFRMHFVTDGKQAYSKSYSTYSDPYYSYNFYNEVGDDISYLSFHGEDGDYTDYEKFPKAAFSETVCKSEAAYAFVALTKGEDGEFLPGMDMDDYYKDDGYPYIQDNKFMVLMIHPRSLDDGYRYFYEIYEYYNIGNSKLTLPASSKPSQDFMENEMPIGDYRLGGVRYRWASYGAYNNMKSYYSAELYVSYHTKIFLEPGTYTVLPYMYDKPVMAIVHYSYYSRYYNYDQSGYTFNLYIDEDGVYQGEYADLGSISRLDIRDFIYDDGTVNYYADWHD